MDEQCPLCGRSSCFVLIMTTNLQITYEPIFRFLQMGYEADPSGATLASLPSPGDAGEARNRPGLPAHGGGWARGAAAR